MSAQSTNDAPTPVLPLDESGPSWGTAVRVVSLLCVLLQGYSLLSYAVEVGCCFWQSMGSVLSPRGITALPIEVRIPMECAGLIIFVGALDSLKLIEGGRRWIVTGAMMMLITVPLTEIWNAIYFTFINQHWVYGTPYVVMYFVRYLMAGVGGCIWPAVIWVFFRRSEVREVFNRRPRSVL
jgi:hypothetical protein